MKRYLCSLLALGLLASGAGQAKADYIITTLDVPGSNGTALYAINNAGDVVGLTDSHAFVLSGGRYTTFDPPGESYSVHGINDAGQIVGFYQTTLLTEPVGFLLNGGNFTKLVFPGSLATRPLGINDSGQIIGYYSTGERGPYYGFLLNAGRYSTTTGPPGSVGGTIAYAINNSGHILVGSSLGTFVMSGDTYTPLKLPGDPTGINDADEVIGSYEDAKGEHGFLLEGGSASVRLIPWEDHP